MVLGREYQQREPPILRDTWHRIRGYRMCQGSELYDQPERGPDH
ncbi:hypothetical protein OAE21_03285 [Rubripirellula sp.]|nr:hypothetical protein [Rubripirellula sp.]MDB4533047.1 hypothetical protein [bacterium]MDB4625077.1 hypothetical protein [Rubripirellula sp.]